MRSVRVVAVIATTLLTLPALAACTGADEPVADPTPSAETTPLADVETGSVTVARDSFCERVAPAAVESALGAAPEATDTWSNGERAQVEPGLTDVVHEYGCAWTAGRTRARAWVFAPPVTADQADLLGRAAARTRGCEPATGAATFGTHDVSLHCTADGSVTVTLRGLFGDAWLSCSLQVPRTGPDALDRAEQWCATVLAAAAA